MNLFPSYFAAYLLRDLTGIAMTVGGLVLAGIIAVTAMYFHHRRREMWHQTARLALEKGQPIPPLPDAPPNSSRHRKDEGNDFRDGLILVGVGFGIYLFFDSIAGDVRFVGAIPGFIGVALLVHGLFKVILGGKKTTNDDRPPQS